MNEYEMARAAVLDKNNSFAKLHEKSGVSIPRLKEYRSHPDKLRTAKWIAVHKLAKIFKEGSKMNGLFKADDAKHLERGWARKKNG